MLASVFSRMPFSRDTTVHASQQRRRLRGVHSTEASRSSHQHVTAAANETLPGGQAASGPIRTRSATQAAIDSSAANAVQAR